MSLPLAIQEAVRTIGIAGLFETRRIKARRHSAYPNLVCLKYDQRLSPMSDPVVQQARGIILDEDNDWAVVSRSFDKFFNLEEGHAADIDWETAQVEEKLDGSLMVLYMYNGEWQVQSSGTADASGAVYQDLKRGQAQTYAQLFWEVWEELGYRLPPFHALCFAFELMTPQNRVVVHHAQRRLVLHGVRHPRTGQEENAEMWAGFMGYEAVKTFPLSREGIRAAADAIPAKDGEGFVVRDAQYRRVKVKSPEYVQWSHLKEGWTAARAWDVVISGEESEVQAYFPEYAAQLAEYRALYNRWVELVNTTFRRIEVIEEQKAFALEATQTGYPAVLFALRRGQYPDPESWLAAMGPSAQLSVLTYMLALEGETVTA